ncbi:MAG: HAD-IA family hydrolase [Treponema sp.]|nr:HAD-IA family hydrolase [Treponema sp.]
MIKYLLFDLDNTLYSCNYGLEDNVSRRIFEFAAAWLGVSPEEVLQQRKASMRKYGTCLEWLMSEKGFTDTETYLKAVHPEGEADALTRDDALRDFLSAIPLPKAILTNSPKEHADLILGKLGIADLFTHVFEIRQIGFKGKPNREFFEYALGIMNVSPGEVLFIDDHPMYVEGFIALGGNALLMDENDIHKNCSLPKIRSLGEIIKLI